MEKEIEELKAQVETQKAEIKAKDAELAKKDVVIQEQGALIEEMHKAMSSAPAAGSGTGVTVTFEKKQYKVTVPKFSFDGKEYTAESLKENKLLVAELIKRRSGILEAVK